MHEECGIFGVYAPGHDVARLTFFGLYALQHRGQESAGIATGDGALLRLRTHMGLVSQAFSESDLAALPGHIAVGHTRYSTTGSCSVANASPIRAVCELGEFAVAHNGNLVNAQPLRHEMSRLGAEFASSTDSEVITQLIADAPGRDWVEKIRRAMPRFMGSYSLVIATPDRLIGVRDPFGVRPLCLGRLEGGVGGWVLASESCALMTIGAALVREIAPGEIVVIDAEGYRAHTGMLSEARAMCLFEYIYFARPDSIINDRRVYLTRQRMGEELAREHPVDADVVVPVPDSAIPAAIGYSQVSGIPFAEGLIKNRYIGRTFIQPDQRLRDVGVGLKFNPLPEVLRGKRVVLVDDSIVRGTTTQPLVRLLRQAGAEEVHVRIHSPAFRFPCYLGLDVATRHELIAAHKSVDEIATHINANSLGYLSVDGLLRAIDLARNEFCTGCFTSNYPVPIQMDLMDKLALERPQPVAATLPGLAGLPTR
ncbi:MAG: amidophosphoribosyltransferase [Chloroflexi bacterium]|nr:amidophosphoribosyltransferase [Chloroflexota bacterium]